MKWPLVKIGEYSEIVSGSTPKTNIEEYWNGDVHWVTPKDISGLDGIYIYNTNKKISKKGLESCSTHLLPSGSVLLSSRAPIGLLAINGVPMCTNQGFKSIIPEKGKLHNEFLYFYLKSKREYLNSIGNGATFKEISKESFSKVLIPLPPLDDQIRIATLLSKVENLISRRREQLKQLDELLKSVFLEMFGDPVRNEKGWERVTIRDLISEAKYGTSKSAEGGQYKYLRMNNISTNGFWDFTSLKYIDIDDYEVSKYLLVRNDLVFNRTNSKELVGKTAVYSSDEKVIIAGYLIRVRTKPEANPWYIWGYLNSKAGKLRLFNLCRNIVGMANINAQELQDISILKPPIDLQNQFEAIVSKVEFLRARYTQSLNELELLYGTLSQKAFKAELDLSSVKIEGVGDSQA